jgi:DNA-directed RNA polymerase beta subunit
MSAIYDPSIFVDPVSAFAAQTPLAGTLKTCFMIRELESTPRDELTLRVIRDFGPLNTVRAAYNHWIANIVGQQIAAKSVVDDRGVFSFQNVRLRKPRDSNGRPLFPYAARRYAITYSADLIADVHRFDFESGESTLIVSDETLISIPILLGSFACNLYGYTPEELRAVYEDESDPMVYSIVRGSERGVIIQDSLAFNQLISPEIKGAHLTRSTSHRVSGTTVLATKLGKKFESVEVIVFQSGMKGSQSRPEFPALQMFDVLLQISEPDTYGYEFDRDMPPELVTHRRGLIVARAFELILRHVPPQHHRRVIHFLAPTHTAYALVKTPINHLIVMRSHGSQIAAVAKASLTSIARREASNMVAANSRVAEAENAAGARRGSRAAKLNLEAARREAAASIERLMKASERAREEGGCGNYEDCATTIVREFFTDVFPGVAFSEKPSHLARTVAQQCAVSTGIRVPDDMDSWSNRRIKTMSDVVSQLLNANLKAQMTQSGYLSLNAVGTSSQLTSAFSVGKDSPVYIVRRDTPMSLLAQASRVNTPVQRKSKNVSARLIHATHFGTVCPAETPGGDTCGITKNLSCTVSQSVRRDTAALIASILIPLLEEVYDSASPSFEEGSRFAAIAVDGHIYGFVNPRELIPLLRPRVKSNAAFFDVSISYSEADRAVDIYTTGTRTVRPLFTVENRGLPGTGSRGLVIDSLGPGAYSWGVMDLVVAGAIEFTSVSEQSRYFLVEDPKLVGEKLDARDAVFAAGEQPIEMFLDMYSEMHPVALVGLMTSMMPRPDTCQGPRVNYQAAMTTQSLGLFHDCYYARDDGTFKRTLGSRPTVDTMTTRQMGLARAPTGIPLIVAFLAMANDGEDGAVVNARTMAYFTVTKYTTQRVTIKAPVREVLEARRTGGQLAVGLAFEELGRPDEAAGDAAGTQRHALYRAIGEDGLPRINSYISKGSCVIAKTWTVVESDGTVATRNTSIYANLSEEGVVDRVSIVAGETDQEDSGEVATLIIRIRIRQTRGIKPGDKIASRYAQKVTIAAERSNTLAIAPGTSTATEQATRGEALGKNLDAAAARAVLAEQLLAEGTRAPTEQETADELEGMRFARDLPRIATGPNAGLEPDIIIHPASQPSRMTIGKILEMYQSKVALYTGTRYNGTAFRRITDAEIDDFERVLAAAGENPGGWETMENADGTPFRKGVKVFVAPCYYQILRHTVLDKIQFRNEGAVTQLTRQPIGGRTNEGGLRLGEMEKAACVSHGAAALVQERMMHSSDKYVYEVCATCGNEAATRHSINKRVCTSCPPDKANIVTTETPYVHILIRRMVSCLGINARLSHMRPPHSLPDV